MHRALIPNWLGSSVRRWMICRSFKSYILGEQSNFQWLFVLNCQSIPKNRKAPPSLLFKQFSWSQTFNMKRNQTAGRHISIDGFLKNCLRLFIRLIFHSSTLLTPTPPPSSTLSSAGSYTNTSAYALCLIRGFQCILSVLTTMQFTMQGSASIPCRITVLRAGRISATPRKVTADAERKQLQQYNLWPSRTCLASLLCTLLLCCGPGLLHSSARKTLQPYTDFPRTATSTLKLDHTTC